MGARASWVGEIVVGLVSMPVSLYNSVREDAGVRFNEFVLALNEDKTGAEIHAVGRVSVDKDLLEKNKLNVVKPEDVIKGYVIGEDVVTVTDDELKALAPIRSKSLIVETFVPAGALVPEDFSGRHLHIAPGKGGDQVAGLLYAVLTIRKVVGIGRIVVRGKEYLASVRPTAQNGLMVSFLNFHSDRVDASDYSVLGGQVFDSGPELAAFLGLVEKMSGWWMPAMYENSHTQRVLKFLHDKHEGKEIVAPEVAEPPASSGSLLDLLERSVKTPVTG